MADSISADVVPGAKLLANTTNGPGAVPLMLMPLLRTEACPLSGSRAETMRSSFGRRLLADAGRVGARGGARELLLDGFGLNVAEAERYGYEHGNVNIYI